MKNKKQESRNLVEMKNFLDYNKKINKEDNTFQKLMVIYKMAIKELNTKVEIIKEEFETFYNYELIDHINTRIKTCNLQNCKISIYTYTINRPSNGRSKNKGIFIRLFIKIMQYFS